jgi:hypothetical protein
MLTPRDFFESVGFVELDRRERGVDVEAVSPSS